MLASLVLVLLVFGGSEGRILSKCELKEQLEASQIQVIRATGDKTAVDKLIAKFVCYVENTSGFNTSLVTSVQISPDESRPPFQIPPKPKEDKPPAKEEEDDDDNDEKMEDEHIIPVQPPSRPKGRRGRSASEGKAVEIHGAKKLFWMWSNDLFPEATSTESSGSGSEASSEEISSGDSSEEEERGDAIMWNQLGIFQLSDRIACGSGSGRSLNLCGLECSALVDDEISDDIACLKTLAKGHSKMLAALLVKKCRSAVTSKYFAECS